MDSPGEEPTGALVRPYAVTGGRTRPKVEIAIEALVETTQKGRPSEAARRCVTKVASSSYIVTLCDGRLQSLAEISARMSLPVGSGAGTRRGHGR